MRRLTYAEAWIDIDLLEECLRFKALVDKVKENVALASAEADDPDAWSIHVLPYIPIINTFIRVKDLHYDLDDYQMLCKALLTAVLGTSHDLESHSRIATCLRDALHERRRDLYHKTSFALDWRPLFACLTSAMKPAPHIEHMMNHNKLSSLFNLVTEARRFFRGPEVMKEIWAALSPQALADVTFSDRILALIHLGLFLPTHSLMALPASGPELDFAQSILNQSVKSWWLSKSSSSDTSKTLWIKVISRMLRHDRRRCLNVLNSSLHQKMFSYLFDSLNLQVGTSSGSSPIPSPLLRPDAQTAANLILQVNGTGDRESRFDTLVSTLVHICKKGKVSIEEDHSDRTSNEVLDLFDRFRHLVDQYLHPSNGGPWSKECASIIRNLVKALVKQVSHQNVDEEEGGWVRDKEEARLEETIVSRLVSITVAMASRAQFSKSPQLSLDACKALGTMAYFSPTTVLPLVVERYNLAMESTSSPHQLALSLHALAYSVRPMLHSRWRMGDDEENGGSLQLLAASLTALLPGLDANDLPKTKAVLHLFITILLSVPHLSENEGSTEASGNEGPTEASGLRLPLFLDEWSEEIMGKLIELIENQEPASGSEDLATKHGGSDGAFDDISEMVGMLTNLLLSKLNLSQQRHMIGFISKWVLGSSVHSMQEEVAHLAAEVASECPDLTLELLLSPLVKQCRESLPSLSESESKEAKGHPPLSHTAEARAIYLLGVLADVIIQFPGNTLVSSNIFNDALEAADQAMSTSVKDVQAAGSKLLASIAHTVSRPFCDYYSASACPIGKDGVFIWGGKSPDDNQALPAPKWRSSSEIEGKAVEVMFERFVNGPCKKLMALNGSENKSEVLTLVLSIWSVLGGLNSRLDEFEFVGPPSNSSKASVVRGVTDSSFGRGIRGRIAEVFTSCFNTLLSQHPSILQTFVSCIQQLLNNGDQAYQSYRGISSSIHRLNDLYSEPGGLAMVQESLGGGWRAKGNRWPLPTTYLKVQEAYWHRLSQSSFRSFASTGRPMLALQDLPQPFLSLFTILGSLSRSVHDPVRHQAKDVLATLCLRFPCLARIQLGHTLAHLASVTPPPPPLASWSEDNLLEEERSLFQRIALAAQREGAVEKVDLSPAQESERDAIVKGSCSFLLSCLHAWRIAFRSCAFFSASMQTLLSTRIHDSQSLQPEIASLILHTLSRFVHPPSLVALRSRHLKGPRWEVEVSRVTELRAALMKLSDPSGPLQGSTFRFLFLANALLVLTCPFTFSTGEARGSTVPVLKHLLGLLSSNSLELRRLAISGVTFLASGVINLNGGSKITHLPQSTEPFAGGRETLEQFFADAGNVSLLWNHLVHDHQVLEQLEESKTKRGGRELWSSHSMEEKVFRYLEYGLSTSFGAWPSESSHAALSDGLFVTPHAKLIGLLSRLVPALASSLLPLLEKNTSPEKLQSTTTPSEKCEQAVVSEVYAGLAASGSLNDPSILAKALKHGTLEMGDSWSLSVRFASTFIMSRTYETPAAGDARMSEPSKDHFFLEQILTTCTKSTEEFDHLSTQGRIKALRCMTQITQEVIKLSIHLLDTSYGLVLRDHVGPLVAELLGVLDLGPSPDLPPHLVTVIEEGNQLQNVLASRFKQATGVVGHLRPQANQPGVVDKMMVDGDPPSDRGLAHDLTTLGIGMSLVSKGLRAPVDPHGPLLATVISLLPSLLALQELAGMDLQKLATESALSLSLIKYLAILDDVSRDSIASALIQAMKGDHWSERTAALLFMQKFWSCHGFALSPLQHERIKDAVNACLADPREEVRRAASSTLSGLLKVMDEGQRESFMEQVLLTSGSLFKKKRTKGLAADPAPRAAELLSHVEGLRALLQSAPYDCPRWLGKALSALVVAANKEGAAEVKKEAVKAVMDWKRTHEADSVAALKNLMDEDEFLEFQAIGGSSSYFV